jgi:hypothetical protein
MSARCLSEQSHPGNRPLRPQPHVGKARGVCKDSCGIFKDFGSAMTGYG